MSKLLRVFLLQITISCRETSTRLLFRFTTSYWRSGALESWRGNTDVMIRVVRVSNYSVRSIFSDFKLFRLCVIACSAACNWKENSFWLKQQEGRPVWENWKKCASCAKTSFANSGNINSPTRIAFLKVASCPHQIRFSEMWKNCRIPEISR